LYGIVEKNDFILLPLFFMKIVATIIKIIKQDTEEQLQQDITFLSQKNPIISSKIEDVSATISFELP